MKKVVLINDYLVGGGAEQVYADHKNLLSIYFDLYVFYGSLNNVKPGLFQHFFSVSNFLKLFYFLRKVHPEIIHLHNFHNFLSPSILLAIRIYKVIYNRNIRILYTAHDYHLICPDSLLGYYKNGSFRKLENSLTFFDFINLSLSKSKVISIYKKLRWILAYKFFGLRNIIDVIIAPSEFLKNKFQYSLPQKEIKLVRNPLLLNHNCVKIKDKNLNEPIGIVFIGRISIEKGILEFIEMLSKIENQNYILSIYGDGPANNLLKESIKKWGLENKVELKGRIEHKYLPNELVKYDVLVLPSIWYENAPLVLAEGANYGLRLLTCDYGGMNELGQLCGNAYFFNYDDQNTLSNALTDIENDIKNGVFSNYVSKVQEIFSPKVYSKEIQQLYSNTNCE